MPVKLPNAGQFLAYVASTASSTRYKLSLHMLQLTVSFANTAKLVDISFFFFWGGGQMHVDLKYHVLDVGTTWWMRLDNPCLAEMLAAITTAVVILSPLFN